MTFHDFIDYSEPPRVFVVGEVEHVGAKDLIGTYTIFEAVLDAHPKAFADVSRIRVLREDGTEPVLFTVNCNDFIDRGDTSLNFALRANDVVVVPAR